MKANDLSWGRSPTVPADAASVREGAAEISLFLRLRFKWGGLWETPCRTK